MCSVNQRVLHILEILKNAFNFSHRKMMIEIFLSCRSRYPALLIYYTLHKYFIRILI